MREREGDIAGVVTFTAYLVSSAGADSPPLHSFILGRRWQCISFTRDQLYTHAR